MAQCARLVSQDSLRICPGQPFGYLFDSSMYASRPLNCYPRALTNRRGLYELAGCVRSQLVGCFTCWIFSQVIGCFISWVCPELISCFLCCMCSQLIGCFRSRTCSQLIGCFRSWKCSQLIGCFRNWMCPELIGYFLSWMCPELIGCYGWTRDHVVLERCPAPYTVCSPGGWF